MIRATETVNCNTTSAFLGTAADRLSLKPFNTFIGRKEERYNAG